MQLLTVRHVTTYRYRRPVSFGEHRMMLRPRDSYDQRLIEVRLDITPQPGQMPGMSTSGFGHPHCGPGPAAGESALAAALPTTK